MKEKQIETVKRLADYDHAFISEQGCKNFCEPGCYCNGADRLTLRRALTKR